MTSDLDHGIPWGAWKEHEGQGGPQTTPIYGPGCRKECTWGEFNLC